MPCGLLVQVVVDPEPPVSHEVFLSVLLLGFTPAVVASIPELFCSA